MKLSAYVAALLAGASLVVCAAAQSDTARPEYDPYEKASFAFRVFRDAEGLPQNTVHAIALDTLGRLWVGTQDGAAFYDGKAWHTVDMPSRLQSNFIRSILAASDGSIWFGTRAGGLFRLHDGNWSQADSLCIQTGCLRINTLAETKSTSGDIIVWAGTYGGGLGRLENGRWQIFSTQQGLPNKRVWGLLAEEGATGTTLWVGTETGLAVLKPGSDSFSVEPWFPTGSVNSIIRVPGDDGQGALWVSTYGDGLFRLKDNGESYSITTEHGLPSNFFTSLVLGASIGGGPSLWAGSDGGGLIRISKGTIETISVRSGLPSNAVYSLLETHAANAPSMLWVGTRNGGLAQLIEGSWRHVIPDDLPSVAPINAILETRGDDGSMDLWLGSDGEGLYRLTKGEWTQFTDQLPTRTVQCLSEERTADGRSIVWVGTRNGGLLRYSNGRWTRFTEEDGSLPSNMVQAILVRKNEDLSSRVVVGTRYGLAEFSGGEWTRTHSVEGQSLGSVLSLLETKEPNGGTKLWVGSTEGLATLYDGEWHVHNQQAGLLNSAVQCLFERTDADGNRRIWAGTDGGGVTVLNADNDASPVFTLTDTSTPRLPSAVINAIVEDFDGRIYLLTNAGVAKLTEIGNNSNDPGSFSLTTYTTEDGLPLNEGNQGAALVDDSGRIWIGTVGGAAVLDPSAERQDRHADQLILNARLASAPHELLAPGIILNHRNKHIIFDYALLSYFKESQSRFKIQLVGLDKEPTTWSPETRKEYQTLSNDEYTFRVWSRDHAGNISGPVDFDFEVLAAPWETWWAIVLMALLMALLVFLGFRTRVRHLKIREQTLSRLVDSRTRELAAANETLVGLSYADSLTGVGNRRRFDQILEAEWRRAIRSKQPLALILLDIDHFKKFNDDYGHPEGDECLKTVAATISDCLPRTGDSVARYGGDEFAVILPGTDLGGALVVAEQLRKAISSLEDRQGPTASKPKIEVSLGVGAMTPSSSDDPRKLLKAADNGLYKAKFEGRNRVAAGSINGD